MAVAPSLRSRTLAALETLARGGNVAAAGLSFSRGEVVKQDGGSGIWGGAFDTFMGIDRGLTAGAQEIKDQPADYARARTSEPYLFTCELVRGRAITQVPLKCFQMDDRKRVKEVKHDALKVLQQTNPYGWCDGPSLLRYTLTSLDFHGHNAWQLAFGRSKRPTEIYWQIPQAYTPIPDKTKPMRVFGGLKVNDELGQRVIPADEVCYFATDNPSDPLMGTSKIAVLKNPINLRAFSVWNNIAFFANSMRPDWMLSGNFSNNEENVSEIRRQIRRMLSGANNRAPLILGEGMQAHLLTTSHEDAQWVEQQRLAQEELSSVFGVPLIYLNNLERATYENIKTAKVLLWHDTMIPEGDDMAGLLNRRYFWRWWPEAATRNLELGFDYNEIEGLGEDLAMIWERVVKMSLAITEQVKNRELTPNQARVLRSQLFSDLGIDCTPFDGDVMAGDSFFERFEMVPADQLSVQATMNVWGMRGQNPEYIESVPGAPTAGQNADDVLDRITTPKPQPPGLPPPPGPGGQPPALPPGPGGGQPAPPGGNSPAPAPPAKALDVDQIRRDLAAEVERAVGQAAVQAFGNVLRLAQQPAPQPAGPDVTLTKRRLKRLFQDQQTETLRSLRAAQAEGREVELRELYNRRSFENRLADLVGEERAAEVEGVTRAVLRSACERPGGATSDGLTAVFRDAVERRASLIAEGKADAPDAKRRPLSDQITAAEEHHAESIQKALSDSLKDREQVAREWSEQAVGKTATADEPSDVQRRQASSYASGLELDLAQLGAVFRSAYADGWVLGIGGAFQAMDDGGFAMASDPTGAYAYAAGIDWSKWKPGDAGAADQLSGQQGGAGLANLLDGAGVTIQGVSDTTLDLIAKALADGAARGDSVQTIAKALEDVLGDPDRSMLIARTELARGVSEATLDTYRFNGIQGKGWMVYSPCPLCAQNAAAGVIPVNQNFPSGDPAPPAHPNCFPAGTSVVGPRATGSTVRWYEGQLVEFATAAGHLVSVTPNHPILTDQGWVAAGLLHEGSHVVCCSRPERVAALIDPDHHHGPALIEDVSITLGGASSVTTRSVPVAAEDFHGDGFGAEVCVVRTDGLLRHESSDAAVSQPPLKQQFGGRTARRSFAAEGDLHPVVEALLDAAHRGMGSLDIPAPFVGGALRQREVNGLGRGPLLDAGDPQPTVNHRPAHSEAVGQGQHRFPAVVEVAEPVRHWSSPGLRSELDGQRVVGSTEQATFPEEARQGSRVHVELCRHRIDALAGEVELDRVVEARIVPFAGHVYNLETAGGWYIANGIVSHNCRCSLSPEVLSKVEVLSVPRGTSVKPFSVIVGKEAYYATRDTDTRTPAHDHSTDPGDTPVIVVDLHRTLTPSSGFTDAGYDSGMRPPFPGVKAALDLLQAGGCCIHIATAALSPYHSLDVVAARQKAIAAWISKYQLPISYVTGKVGAHTYYDDRMVRVPAGGDWTPVLADTLRRINARFDRGQDGIWRRQDIPEIGDLYEYPAPESILPDAPRALSTPVVDVDMHRCLTQASSSTRDDDPKPGAVDAMQALTDAGYMIHLSCQGWDPLTHTKQETAERLAGMRQWCRSWGIPYDEFISKDHGDVFIDDKGWPHVDWEADLPTLLDLLGTPHPEDEVTRMPNEPAPGGTG